jgi:hypothetical protein
MMDADFDRKLRCACDVTRGRRRGALRPALIDDEGIGHSTAFFEVHANPRKQISTKRWPEMKIARCREPLSRGAHSAASAPAVSAGTSNAGGHA